MKALLGTQPCPCGRVDAKARPMRYEQCCAAYLERNVPAEDAETLMRSRYSAFVLERSAYLLATWHASYRPAEVDFDQDAQWLGLEVRAWRELAIDSAEVEFVARHRVRGRAVRLHERSRFTREDGRWYYLNGEP